MHHLILAVIIFIASPSAQATSEAFSFPAWVKLHESKFAKCVPTKDKEFITLCDNTRIKTSALHNLFQLPAPLLLNWIQAQGVRVEILCDQNVTVKDFAENCIPLAQRPNFKKMTSMHGKYLPKSNTIVVRASATTGTLIHEYIHHLQNINDRPIYGRVYKKERLLHQAALLKVMDRIIAQVQTLEKKGKKKEAKALLPEFMQASNGLQAMGKWQDLIDERSIFLTYIQFAGELGIAKEDVALAKKNMGFICKRKDLKPLLTGSQCL
jgi:hypothetical protein